MSETNYVNLGRTFIELPNDNRDYKEDVLDYSDYLSLHSKNKITWIDLLRGYRTILLSEAGSGKTEEIRHQASELRIIGKKAFFIRLENIDTDLTHAFERDLGNLTEFQSWLSSGEEGWVFLDSIDEARLRSAQDFKKAIQVFSSYVADALQRVHIVITGRVNAWRPTTDLALCNEYLPYNPPNIEAVKSSDDELPNTEELDATLRDTKTKKSNKSITNNFKFYSLADLSGEQIRQFLQYKNVEEIQRFLSEIEQKDAQDYTARPQDLLDVIDYWNKYKKIGSRLELIKFSVEKRLQERDQSRADMQPLSVEKSTAAAKKIAIASILSQEPNLIVPDGQTSSVGFDIKSILLSLDDKQCNTLLSRPIFKPAIYGCVRFCHRSIREYLAAEWLYGCLANGGNRVEIERLFFRKQYGVNVIIPTTRGILNWLILLDIRIRKKAFKIEPEIIFECGDPSKLPLEVRSKGLKAACRNMAENKTRGTVADYTPVKKFSSPDLVKVIKRLLNQYSGNFEITSFLLRMIWKGHIKEALPEALIYATDNSADKNTRVAAIRAVKALGSEKDFARVLNSFKSYPNHIDRWLLAEIIINLNENNPPLEWLFESIKKPKKIKKYSVDYLDNALVSFTQKLQPADLVEFLKKSAPLLEREPLIERWSCEVSEQFSWLIPSCAKAIEQLIQTRHVFALSDECLSLFSRVLIFRDYEDYSFRTKTNFSELINSWFELKIALFWKDVEISRKRFSSNKNFHLIRYFQAHALRLNWNFEPAEFEKIVGNISQRELHYDKRVALSLAFNIYQENSSPSEWLALLILAVAGDEGLEADLGVLMHPPEPTLEMKNLAKEDASWKKKQLAEKYKTKKNRTEALEWLQKNFSALSDEKEIKKLLSEDKILSSQRYLFDRMREYEDSEGHWTNGNWSVLIKEFGNEISEAFRDSLLILWRNYRPDFRSEDDTKDSTPGCVIMGLAGLAVEARETLDWSKSLNDEEVKLACRYAFCELNGFPAWFPDLYQNHPSTVGKLLLQEIQWELNESSVDGEAKNYILSRVAWDSKRYCNDIGKDLLHIIDTKAVSLKNLNYILRIVNQSPLSDVEIETAAGKKCLVTQEIHQLGNWYATWIGVNPYAATKSLSKKLKSYKNTVDATELAMIVVILIVGDLHGGPYVRDNHKQPEHLKKLYLLMHDYIKVSEDRDRSDEGVYALERRDEAQNAREGLLSTLIAIPSKQSYMAMLEIANKHPEKNYKAWIANKAKQKARDDADITPYEPNEVLSFLDYISKEESSLLKNFTQKKFYLFGHVMTPKDLKDIIISIKYLRYIWVFIFLIITAIYRL